MLLSSNLLSSIHHCSASFFLLFWIVFFFIKRWMLKLTCQTTWQQELSDMVHQRNLLIWSWRSPVNKFGLLQSLVLWGIPKASSTLHSPSEPAGRFCSTQVPPHWTQPQGHHLPPLSSASLPWERLYAISRRCWLGYYPAREAEFKMAINTFLNQGKEE